MRAKTKEASLSTLNPYAESYIPIALREANSGKPDTAVSDDCGTEKLRITDASKLKSQKDDNPRGTTSRSNEVTEMKLSDEEFEMDLAYLQVSFPGMSDQSLIDVYTVNDGDLEASVEMLSQLESVETPDSLPDALDIGDVPEAVPSGKCSTTKDKNVAAESGSSSSTDLVPS